MHFPPALWKMLVVYRYCAGLLNSCPWLSPTEISKDSSEMERMERLPLT